MQPIGTKSKSIVAALLTALFAALVSVYSQFTQATADSVITTEEWSVIILGFLATLALVWAVPFDSLSRLGKPIVALLTFAVTWYFAARADLHIDSTEWYALVVGLLVTAGGTWLVPNAPETVALPPAGPAVG